MNEPQLKDLLEEMEARAAEFKGGYLNLKSKGSALRHYWNGKLSETLFVIEKLHAIFNSDEEK